MKQCPKVESFVETPDGAGTVSSVSLLRQQVKVRLDRAPESPRCYHSCELNVIRNGKGKRPEGYVEPPLEQLAQLRRKTDVYKRQSAACTTKGKARCPPILWSTAAKQGGTRAGWASPPA